MAGLSLDGTQLDRYSRHIIMDEVGPDGQKNLLDGKVLVIGAGGLGAPVIEYLAAAGIGRVGIADDDVVERSNLQRQVIHRDADVGRKKAESAAEFVSELNPDIGVETHDTRVTAENVEDLVAEYDFVVDGSDNFQTRYLVNDACVLSGTPFSHGAIYQFEGQITTVASGGEPCYRCLFPEAPPEGTIPDCSEAGVLGVLPGTVGCIQATETVKYFLGKGDLLEGTLLFYDALDMSFEKVPYAANPDCPICSTEGRIESIHEIEYEGTCPVPAE